MQTWGEEPAALGLNATQYKVQNRIKTKLHDKAVLYVIRSLYSSNEDNGRILGKSQLLFASRQRQSTFYVARDSKQVPHP